jgi:hypothetical protein
MIFAVDIGSTRKGRRSEAFAWCGLDDSGRERLVGTCPEALTIEIHRCIQTRESVALGFEAPLFVPVPNSKEDLSKGRSDEGDRAWSAPAGGYVATLALHQCAWIFRALHASCAPICRMTTDPKAWSTRSKASPLIFLWEAFVSGRAHGTHAEDARTAAMHFAQRQNDLRSDITAENPLSLIGAAILWSDWSNDIALLRTPLLVLRPATKWTPDS